MGLETIAMATAGAGSALTGIGQARHARRMGKRSDELFAQSQIPTFLEDILRSQFNTGQDGINQMLRNLPGGETLDEIMATGLPFDTSRVHETLTPLRNRQHHEGLANLRSEAPGLGQRFGSAMMREEGRMTGEHLQNIAAQDAQIEMGAHESAAGRRLDAARHGGGMITQLLELLGRTELGRRGQGLEAFGMTPTAPRWGQPGVDIGQMLLLRQLLGGGGGGGAGGGFTPGTLSGPDFIGMSLWGDR